KNGLNAASMSIIASGSVPTWPVERSGTLRCNAPVRSAQSTTTLIASFVTPCAVAPPLSSLLLQGLTQGGADGEWNLMRLVVASQFGPASAAALPMPGSLFDAAAADDGTAPDPSTVTASAALTANASRGRPRRLVPLEIALMIPPVPVAGSYSP